MSKSHAAAVHACQLHHCQKEEMLLSMIVEAVVLFWHVILSMGREHKKETIESGTHLCTAFTHLYAFMYRKASQGWVCRLDAHLYSQKSMLDAEAADCRGASANC